MKSKAEEVLGSLGELVRVLLVEGEHRRELADEAANGLADDLCDEPGPKEIEGSVVPAEDPTTSHKSGYFLWVDRWKDGPVTFERLLKDDYLMGGGNPLRIAPSSGWRGRRLRVTFTDITDGEPQTKVYGPPTNGIMEPEPPCCSWGSWAIVKGQVRLLMSQAWQEGYDRRDKREPGGTANNPYHEGYLGLSPAPPPESWTEERAALLDECEQRRKQTKKLQGELATALAALKGEQERSGALAEASGRSRGDLERANDFRCDLVMALELCADIGRTDLPARDKRGTEALKAAIAGATIKAAIASATTYQWQEWGRTLVGGGINLAPLDLFEAVKQEVAILLETSRASERNAREAREALDRVKSR